MCCMDADLVDLSQHFAIGGITTMVSHPGQVLVQQLELLSCKEEMLRLPTCSYNDAAC